MDSQGALVWERPIKICLSSQRSLFKLSQIHSVHTAQCFQDHLLTCLEHQVPHYGDVSECRLHTVSDDVLYNIIVDLVEVDWCNISCH